MDEIIAKLNTKSMENHTSVEHNPISIYHIRFIAHIDMQMNFLGFGLILKDLFESV